MEPKAHAPLDYIFILKENMVDPLGRGSGEGIFYFYCSFSYIF